MDALTVEMLKLGVTTLVAVVVGVATFRIAKGQRDISAAQRDIASHQRQIAQAKLNLDLFDRRLLIFEATWSFLSRVVQEGAKELSDAEFTNLLPKAQFLFGTEIRDYMVEATGKKADLWLIDQRAKARNDIIDPADINSRMQLMTWFGEQATTGCRSKFAPYLDFSSWRAEQRI